MSGSGPGRRARGGVPQGPSGPGFREPGLRCCRCRDTQVERRRRYCSELKGAAKINKKLRKKGYSEVTVNPANAQSKREKLNSSSKGKALLIVCLGMMEGRLSTWHAQYLVGSKQSNTTGETHFSNFPSGGRRIQNTTLFLFVFNYFFKK